VPFHLPTWQRWFCCRGSLEGILWGIETKATSKQTELDALLRSARAAACSKPFVPSDSNIAGVISPFESSPISGTPLWHRSVVTSLLFVWRIVAQQGSSPPPPIFPCFFPPSGVPTPVSHHVHAVCCLDVFCKSSTAERISFVS
jgi:hypothetical protein